MRITKETTNWGIIYNYKDKRYRYSLYTYNDRKITIYLSNVRVKLFSRCRGNGNRILELAEKEAHKLGYSKICLKVLYASWKRQWCQRHGYRFLCFDKDYAYAWMIKSLYE